MSVASPVDHRSSTPGDEPRRTIRRDEFYQLCNIQRKLEKLDKTIMVDDADLAELSIIRGAQLDLEDDDPLDFDMRFFLPGTVEAMETALANVDWRWPQLEPIETPKNADLCWLKYSNITSDARCDARDHMDWVTRAAEATHSWERNRYAYKASPHVDERWVTSEDRWRHHMFAGWGVFMWPPGSRAWDARHPDIPHAIATLYDITSPRRSCKLLRSELLQAVTLLKSQIRDDKLIDHQFYPVRAGPEAPCPTPICVRILTLLICRSSSSRTTTASLRGSCKHTCIMARWWFARRGCSTCTPTPYPPTCGWLSGG